MGVVRSAYDRATVLRHKLKLVNESTSRLLGALRLIRKQLASSDPPLKASRMVLLDLTATAINQELKLRRAFFSRAPRRQFSGEVDEGASRRMREKLQRTENKVWKVDESKDIDE